jgi:hypothetical protein
MSSRIVLDHASEILILRNAIKAALANALYHFTNTTSRHAGIGESYGVTECTWKLQKP